MDFLVALTEYSYLPRALITGVIVGVLCGVIGSFMVLRGLALMGDAISHAVLPGVAVSFLLGGSLFPGALVAGLLTALGIGYVNQHSRLRSDAVIGIMFSAMFALGVVMISLSPTSTDLTKILFGNLVAVRPSDMWTTIAVGVLVLACVLAFYKELLITSFDPTMAAAYGLSTRGLHYLLMVMLTLVTVASLQTVGIILVVALLITPAATAYLLTERLSRMIFLAAGAGVVSAVVGLYISFTYAQLPSGATIVLVATALFLLAFVFGPRQGLMWRLTGSRRARAGSAAG